MHQVAKGKGEVNEVFLLWGYLIPECILEHRWISPYIDLFQTEYILFINLPNVLTPVQFNGWRLSCVKKICCSVVAGFSSWVWRQQTGEELLQHTPTEALMEQKAPGGLAGLRCQPFWISALSSCDLMFQFSPFTESVAQMSTSCLQNCLVWFLPKPKSLRIPASLFLVTPAMPILHTLIVPSLNSWHSVSFYSYLLKQVTVLVVWH